MKRLIFLIGLMSGVYGAMAQVAINTSGSDPDGSAMLDVQSTSQGLLIPRMSASDRDGISSPATGLTVYVTDDNSFYYYDGTSWIQLQQAGKSWLLAGNAGTSASTDFLGTTDATDFHIRTNNTDRIIVSSGGAVGVGANPTSATMTVGAGNTEAITAFSNGSSVFAGYFLNQDNSGTALLAVGNGVSGVYLTGGEGIASTGDDIGAFVYASNSSGTGLIAAGNGTTSIYTLSNGGGGSFNGSYNGVYGHSNAASSSATGVYGIAEPSSSADAIGVFGYCAPSASYGYGVSGYGGWIGVYGETDSNGLYAVYASGDFGASGTKSFVIDHPLDPANKYLKHFSIESNEVLNVYRGNVTLDANGEATVQLPHYFHAVNRNFSYMLTPVGQPAPGLYVAAEIDGNGTFKISGGNPGQKISWYVYAERNDPYLQQHPEKRKVEVPKKAKERGKYLMPELYGQPDSKRMVPITPPQKIQKKKVQLVHPEKDKLPKH